MLPRLCCGFGTAQHFAVRGWGQVLDFPSSAPEPLMRFAELSRLRVYELFFPPPSPLMPLLLANPGKRRQSGAGEPVQRRPPPHGQKTHRAQHQHVANIPSVLVPCCLPPCTLLRLTHRLLQEPMGQDHQHHPCLPVPPDSPTCLATCHRGARKQHRVAENSLPLRAGPKGRNRGSGVTVTENRKHRHA